MNAKRENKHTPEPWPVPDWEHVGPSVSISKTDYLRAALDLICAAMNAASQPMTEQARIELLLSTSDRARAALAALREVK